MHFYGTKNNKANKTRLKNVINYRIVKREIKLFHS